MSGRPTKRGPHVDWIYPEPRYGKIRSRRRGCGCRKEVYLRAEGPGSDTDGTEHHRELRDGPNERVVATVHGEHTLQWNRKTSCCKAEPSDQTWSVHETVLKRCPGYGSFQRPSHIHPLLWCLLSNLQMKLAHASRSIPPLLQSRLIQPGSAEMSVVFQPPSHPCELDLRRSSIHTIGIPSAWLHLTASYPVLVGSVSSGPSRGCNCPCSCTHLSSVLSHNLRWSFPPPSATSAGLLCDTRHIGPFLHV